MDSEAREGGVRRDRRALFLRAAATAAVVNAFGVILLGSTVRVTESGMGCSSWPLCNGRIGPISSFHPLLEQVHRYAVSLLVVLVVATLALAWRFAGRLVTRVALVAVCLLVVQALLGAITVWTHNAPVTVALHMLFAELLLGTVVTVLVAVWHGSLLTKGPFAAEGTTHEGPVARAPRPGALALWSLVVMLVVLASGSAVADGGASAACRGWPACGLDGNPTHLIALQYLHRAMVLVLSVLLVALVLREWRSWRGGWARGLAVGVGVLLAAQVAAGAVVAVLGAPEVAQDVHLGLASALWSCTVALVVVAWAASPTDSPIASELRSTTRGRFT